MVAFKRFEIPLPVDEETHRLKQEIRNRDWVIHKLRGELYMERRRRYSGSLFSVVIGGAAVWLFLATVKAWPW